MKGSNQITVRNNNERVILHLIRQRGVLTKAEATRETGLSPNAVSVIFNALEDENLLLRGAALRGRIGQPSVPLRLNPDARYYIGLKIGRQSYEMLVVDFCGTIRARRFQTHAYPTPQGMTEFVRSNLTGLLRSARVGKAQICGTGVAMPSQIWEWVEDFDAAQTEMDAWRDFDTEGQLAAVLPGPVLVENDGTAACRAEWVFGTLSQKTDSIYFFLGTFIGGGIILNGSVFRGCRGNAGGFGPLRIPDEPGGTRLIDHASLSVLDRMLREQGTVTRASATDAGNWSRLEPVLSTWIERASRSLAHAIVSSAAVVDFDHVVIDGSFPSAVRSQLVVATDAYLKQLDLQGVNRPALWNGSFGDSARALGAASIHISARHMIDRSEGLALSSGI